ncbi:MAG: CDP-diacylglycerol--serine O-phosphatidyltransferase [Bacteroidales bacterium]|nr:CDP-diacylglycerol--serine O-phosphatidyltransferase [Bacteroidales bacterium]
MSHLSFIVRHIPNAITCCNLLCGCLSLVFSFGGQPLMACCCIFAATVFDFFDGFAARSLRVHSSIGKELDSLADMVSFGVAPAGIMFFLLLSSMEARGYAVEMYACGWLLSLPAFIIAVFSALRLAKFNIDPRQTDSFIGLPTPANALFISSLAFIVRGDGIAAAIAGNTCFLLAATGVFSFLLLAELPLFSLKFKSFDWKNNKVRYVFLTLSAVILAIFRCSGLAPVILLYILLSLSVKALCHQHKPQK